MRQHQTWTSSTAAYFDSLTLVTILLEIEEDLGVRIALESVGLDDINSIGNIARLVDFTRGARRPAGTETLVEVDLEFPANARC